MKTTPKPKATKNRSGDELLFCGGGLLPWPPLDAVSVGDGDEEVDDETILDVGLPVTETPGETADDGKAVTVPALVATACLTTIRAPSTKA